MSTGSPLRGPNDDEEEIEMPRMDGSDSKESSASPPSNATKNATTASMRHILMSDEAVEQTKVGPDGVEKKVGLLGRLNARRSLLTLTHPVMVALMFSALGLYDAGTDVLLARTFGETVVAEIAPSNDECIQLFDRTWSEYSLEVYYPGRSSITYDRYTRQASCGEDMYLKDYNQSRTTNKDYFDIQGWGCSFPYGDILADPGEANAYFFESCVSKLRAVSGGVTVRRAKLTKVDSFLRCMPECLDRDVSSFTKADLRTYETFSQYFIDVIIAKEGLRLLVWLYVFTVGGICADAAKLASLRRKTFLFKYILYSPGTILFFWVPAVQQMIVETTQAVENGNETPGLKVIDILLNCAAFVLPIKQAQWGGAGVLTWLSLFGTIVMMIISIILTAVQLAHVLCPNASPVGRSASSISKTDRMWSKMEAMEQEIAHHKEEMAHHKEEIAHHKEEIALHKEELALLKETDELHEARLDRLDA